MKLVLCYSQVRNDLRHDTLSLTVVNFKFALPWSLTRKIKSHSINNFAVHSLLRWKVQEVILNNSHFLTIHFSRKGWEIVLFGLGSKKVNVALVSQVWSEEEGAVYPGSRRRRHVSARSISHVQISWKFFQQWTKSHLRRTSLRASLSQKPCHGKDGEVGYHLSLSRVFFWQLNRELEETGTAKATWGTTKEVSFFLTLLILGLARISSGSPKVYCFHRL